MRVSVTLVLAGMVGVLIGTWMLGTIAFAVGLVFVSVCLMAFGLMRDVPPPDPVPQPSEALRRYRSEP